MELTRVSKHRQMSSMCGAGSKSPNFMISKSSLVERVYEAFNARDIDTVLGALHPDVDWPNGWESGRIVGRDGVRDYWTRSGLSSTRS